MRKVSALIALIFCVVLNINAANETKSRLSQSHRHVEQCDRWVDSVYESMTLRERIAQLVVPKIAPNQGQTARDAIKRFVAGNHIGGLLFSKGTLAEYVTMINYAQSLAEIPLMITFDGEWGLSMRIPDTPRFPKNMALGAIDNPRLLYDYGREMARECQLAGVQVNFAPVLDVNSNPKNPVIGTRSFGEDPERVALLGTAYSLGLEDGGVMAVAKHFPGHGDTSTDSHKALTVVKHNREVLDSVDLIPFSAFIDAGCSGVMTGHIILPEIDASGLPASLSPAISRGMLRDSLGFEGLIFTDALTMKGAKTEGRSNAIMALKAGADVLETLADPVAEIDAIVAAVKSGEITDARIEQSCRRVLKYKYLLGLDKRPPVIEIAGLSARLNSPEAEALNRRLTAATMTVLRNEKDLLPITGLERNSIAVVNFGEASDNIFSSFCSRYAKVDRYSVGKDGITAARLDEINSHDIVIAAVYDDSSEIRASFSKFKNIGGLVPVFFISPYAMSKFASSLEGVSTLVLAYENTRLSNEYAAQALFGGIEVGGRLPVDLPGVAPVGSGLKLGKTRLGYSSPFEKGMNPTLTDSLDKIVRKLIADGGMPGCQLLVAKDGDVIYDKCFGVTSSGGPAVTSATVYDLASVSKAAGTLPGLMKAYDMGLYRFDDFMSRYVPGLQVPGKDSLRIREFMFHETGFPASLNMNELMVDSNSYSGKLIVPRRDNSHTLRITSRAFGNNSARLRSDIVSSTGDDRFPIEAGKGIFVGQETYDTIMSRIYNVDLRKTKAYNYSCLNFCLLADMEQRLTGQNHDRFVSDSIFAPLGAYSSCYRPLLTHKLENIAPTERDNFLRKQLVHGYVHDELANFSGGVQGNAGMFSNAEDLAKYCQMLLNGGVYGGYRFLKQSTVDVFTRTKSPTSRRGLGFDKPDIDNPSSSPTCEEADPSVIGHLGFTGTVFWIDPSNNLIFVFLTNRVYPTRETPVFNKSNIRPELFRQVYKAME